ncbi:hypothetical protein [Spiroplasma endosymbiont of Sarcophaga variegata]|uniref:hypothetical protein n=1 Tax=Spiroplasma endosymbiont of Sarcophaga variegata TaxID=3066304 RepID=UPI003AF59837
MVIFSWVLAIILSILLWTTLWIFPNFYAKTTKYCYLRVGIAIWLVIVEADRMWEMLSHVGWQHFSNYFTLYSCTIVAWASCKWSATNQLRKEFIF